MSRFLLLNFEDFGLNQDITKTIQPHTLFCICCLERNVSFINLLTCSHSDYLDNFSKPELKPINEVICHPCHDVLKKIKQFKLQVEQSFSLLSTQALDSENIDGKKRNFEHCNVVNIYLPPKTPLDETETITETPEKLIPTQNIPVPIDENKMKNIKEALQIINNNSKNSSVKLLTDSVKSLVENEAAPIMDIVSSFIKTEVTEPVIVKVEGNTSAEDEAVVGSDTEYEYASGAPGTSTEMKLLTEFVPQKFVTTYSRQDFNPFEMQPTDDDTLRGSSLQIIGDIKIEYDENQMEFDDESPVINHVENPRQIFGVRLNKAPRTSAERGREFRARRAMLKQQSKRQRESDAMVEIATESNGSSENNLIPRPSQIRTLEKRAKSAEATRRWRARQKGASGSSKKQAKTAAERMREYRQRKKLATKILLNHESDQDLEAIVSSSSQGNQRTSPSPNSIPVELTRRGNSQSQQQIEKTELTRENREVSSDNINTETNNSSGNNEEQSDLKPPLSPNRLNIKNITLTEEELKKERDVIAASHSYRTLPYRCDKCLVGFIYRENLDDHNNRKHFAKKGSVICDICEQILYPAGGYTAHRYRHFSRFECGICNKRFHWYESAVDHFNMTHTEPRGSKEDRQRSPHTSKLTDAQNSVEVKKQLVYKCSVCRKVLKNYENLQKHMQNQHLDIPDLQCDLCGRKYRTRINLKRHMAKHFAANKRKKTSTEDK